MSPSEELGTLHQPLIQIAYAVRKPYQRLFESRDISGHSLFGFSLAFSSHRSDLTQKCKVKGYTPSPSTFDLETSLTCVEICV